MKSRDITTISFTLVVFYRNTTRINKLETQLYFTLSGSMILSTSQQTPKVLMKVKAMNFTSNGMHRQKETCWNRKKSAKLYWQLSSTSLSRISQNVICFWTLIYLCQDGNLKTTVIMLKESDLNIAMFQMINLCLLGSRHLKVQLLMTDPFSLLNTSKRSMRNRQDLTFRMK